MGQAVFGAAHPLQLVGGADHAVEVFCLLAAVATSYPSLLVAACASGPFLPTGYGSSLCLEEEPCASCLQAAGHSAAEEGQV